MGELAGAGSVAVAHRLRVLLVVFLTYFKDIKKTKHKTIFAGNIPCALFVLFFLPAHVERLSVSRLWYFSIILIIYMYFET